MRVHYLYIWQLFSEFLKKMAIFRFWEVTNFLIFNQLSRNWFIPGEASLKRTHIQKLICEIIEDQSCTQSSDPNEQETGVEFLEEVCSAVSGPDTDMEVQISLTAKSPISGAQRRRLEELGLNSTDLLKPGTSARFFSNGNCWQTGTLHWRTCMSPVEVIVLSFLMMNNSFLCKLLNFFTLSGNRKLRKLANESLIHCQTQKMISYLLAWQWNFPQPHFLSKTLDLSVHLGIKNTCSLRNLMTTPVQKHQPVDPRNHQR